MINISYFLLDNDHLTFWNFILSFKGKPTCSTKSHPKLKSNERIGYCFGDYYGPYSPDVTFSRSGNPLFSALFNRESFGFSEEFSIAGACSLLVDNHDFKCGMKFGAPKGKEAEDANLDTGAPSKVTECSSGGSNQRKWNMFIKITNIRAIIVGILNSTTMVGRRMFKTFKIRWCW